MRFFATLALLAAVVVPAPVAEAQTNARQRALFVSATDADGNPVSSLSPEDVLVREDGVAREVVSVRPSTDPVDITLLVDNSLASRRAIQDLRRALETFVTTFAGPHAISLMTVADRPTMQVKATTSKAPLLRAVQRLYAQPEAGAYFVDGLIEAADAIRKRKAENPVIIAITSFGTEFSNSLHVAAMDALAGSGAVLHVIELQDTDRANPMDIAVRERNLSIDQGTTQTGGVRELLLANSALSQTLQKTGRIVTTRFELIYGRPDTFLPARKVEVLSSRPTLRVYANVLAANRAAR